MDELKKAMIEGHAINLRSRIVGGTLFGEPVDMYDVDSLILAAYLLGQAEARQMYADDRKREEMLMERKL